VRERRSGRIGSAVFEYDLLGRRTAQKPSAGHDGWTIIPDSRAMSAVLGQRWIEAAHFERLRSLGVPERRVERRMVRLGARGT
jgi:hypothetical protein